MEKKKCEVVRILIKDHYDKKEDLVSRPLVRAYKKLNSENINKFITDGGIYLYGFIEDGIIRELVTQQVIDLNNMEYEIVNSSDVLSIMKSLTTKEIQRIYALISKYVFGASVEIDFVEVSTLEEKAKDRAYLFDEYNNNLTALNPYDKVNPMEYDKSIVERGRKHK